LRSAIFVKEAAVATPDFFIAEIRVEDFRVLADLWMPLAETTVLIGQNNTGKSALLHALGVALGGRASLDDLRVRLEEGEQQWSDSFVVDLRIEPWPVAGVARGSLTFSNEVRQLADKEVQPPDEYGPEFFAIRAEGKPNEGRDDVQVDRRFLQGWSRDPFNALGLPTGSTLPRGLSQALQFQLLEPARDIVDELRNKRTFLGRMLSDLGLNDALTTEIETRLHDVSASVRAGSGRLQRIEKEVREGAARAGHLGEQLTIEPVPASVDSLVRSVDIMIKPEDGPKLPIGLHGTGTRSLGAMTAFSAFVKERLSEATASGLHSLSVAAFEEPEAHLHPQAQRSVFDLIREVPGQKIVATHSPYVAAVAGAGDFRVLQRNAEGSHAGWLKRVDGCAPLDHDALEKIERLVLRRNGECLFARVVMLFEGDTEARALPVYAQRRFGAPPDDLGLTFVPVGGHGNYRYFFRLLTDLAIPWVILGDGDKARIAVQRDLVKELGAEMAEALGERVVLLPASHTFEDILIADGLGDAVEVGISNVCGKDALKRHKQGDEKLRTDDFVGWEDRVRVSFMKAHKVACAEAVAEAIVATSDPIHGGPRYPSKVRELFERVDALLGRRGAP